MAAPASTLTWGLRTTSPAVADVSGQVTDEKHLINNIVRLVTQIANHHIPRLLAAMGVRLHVLFKTPVALSSSIDWRHPESVVSIGIFDQVSRHSRLVKPVWGTQECCQR